MEILNNLILNSPNIKRTLMEFLCSPKTAIVPK